MKSWTDVGRKSGGFALPEVLCAMIILSLSILASFSAMCYSLAMTLEGRGRMEEFSLVMQQGVAMNVWAEDYNNRGNLPAVEGVDKVLLDDPRSPRFDFAVNGSPVTAAGGGNLWLNVSEFRMKPGAATRKNRLMETPAFVVFHTADGADDPDNTPRQ